MLPEICEREVTVPAGVDDDGLHHVCALHTDDVDDQGACSRGEGCRSLCGRDISRVPLTPVPLPGEQECLVCYQMDEA